MSRLVILGAAAALAGCLDLDGSLFQPTRVAGYDWDSADPNLDGELTDPHPSLVPEGDRFEGFVSAAGERIHYVFARRTGATETILYSHGNTDHLGRYWDRVELLWDQGYHVMIYDYPGYGLSSGDPDEAGVYASARAVLAELPAMPGVDMDRLWLYGFSLGGAPTFELATTSEVAFRGILAESIFCSVEALVHDGAFLDLPRDYLSDIVMDNCDKIARVDVPVLLMHGLDDGFIVPRHVDMLAAAQPAAVVQRVPGADHSDLPVVAEDYLTWVDEFLAQ